MSRNVAGLWRALDGGFVYDLQKVIKAPAVSKSEGTCPAAQSANDLIDSIFL